MLPFSFFSMLHISLSLTPASGLLGSTGKTLYYAYGRLLMAATTLGGSLASGGLTSKEFDKFKTKEVMTLIFAICVSDAIYMLSL